MSIYFTADTNFGIESSLNVNGRTFDDVDIMNATLIDKWNSVVTHKDTVYVLGNFGNYDIIPKLNGKIILLEGPREFAIFNTAEYAGIVEYFANKYGTPYLINTSIEVECDLNSEKVPLELILKYNAPEELYNIRNAQCCNLYSNPFFKDIATVHGINVALDLHNFKPVELNTVLFYIKSLLYEI